MKLNSCWRKGNHSPHSPGLVSALVSWKLQPRAPRQLHWGSRISQWPTWRDTHGWPNQWAFVATRGDLFLARLARWEIIHHSKSSHHDHPWSCMPKSPQCHHSTIRFEDIHSAIHDIGPSFKNLKLPLMIPLTQSHYNPSNGDGWRCSFIFIQLLT